MRPPKHPFVVPGLATERAYLAGLIDGEGCITKTPDAWRVAIFNTDEKVIAWLLRFGGNIHWRTRPATRQHWKPSAQWHVSNLRDLLALLESVRPYMVIKAEKADLAIADIRRDLDEVNALTL